MYSSICKLLALTALVGLFSTSPQAQSPDAGPSPLHAIFANWIGDHSAILPYRKVALPFVLSQFVLSQGASWTHLAFPDSLYGNGFGFDSIPDELHIMKFRGPMRMQQIFSAPEYTEVAEMHF